MGKKHLNKLKEALSHIVKLIPGFIGLNYQKIDYFL